MSNRKKQFTGYMQIAVLIIINIVSFALMANYIYMANSDYEFLTMNQNVENISTLTESSSNNVDLIISNIKDDVSTVTKFVNNYNDVGMTLTELIAFFSTYYAGNGSFSWQLAESTVKDQGISSEYFSAKCIVENNTAINISYKTNEYNKLAQIFHKANEDTLGQINYANEFVDPESTIKCFAVTAYVRVRTYNAVTDTNSYDYRTLIYLAPSRVLNSSIQVNFSSETLKYDKANFVIIDKLGNYVFSNEYFLGANILRYFETYNDDFSKDVKTSYLEGLENGTIQQTAFWKNNKGEDCLFVFSRIENSEWYLLSVVPLSSFHNVQMSTQRYLYFSVVLLCIFFVDVSFIMVINRKLKRKTNEAIEASNAKSSFLSSMSHDIRTPMNAIVGMTTVANRCLSEKTLDVDALKDCVNTIQVSSDYLLTLINDILDISKIESGKVALAKEDFSISDMMEKLIEIVQPKIKEKNFEFETHIVNVKHEYIKGDELRIKQIYTNILSNAIKYTDNGGKIVLDFSEESIPSHPEKSRFIYRVQDNGIGMDEEFQKNIFNRFSRAVDSRINKVQGTGLGMSIVKQLVDLMDGTITVESKLNEGSVFTVTLDVALAETQIDDHSIKGLKVLLIDDDAVLVKTAQFSFKTVGINVDCSLDGNEGLNMAIKQAKDNTPYDAVFVDWKLNGICGEEIVRKLREDQKDIKIIVVSAYDLSDIERIAKKSGANCVISKPLFSSKIVHSLNEVMKNKNDESKLNDNPVYDIKLLVAEDNDINWKVLTKLLNYYHIDAERAKNGQIAVDMVKENDYDLVLMDIQMPVMNGYEATKMIRSLPLPKRDVLIYAMTADTFSEDIAKCLSVGMNGHLSKPIDINKLVAVFDLIKK